MVLLLSRHLLLRVGNQHRALRRLRGCQAQSDARLAQREIAHHLAACIRRNPLHAHAGAGLGGRNRERATGNHKGVGGAHQWRAARVHPRVRGDGADLATVRTHQNACGIQKATHHITSSAPLLMFTSESPTTTVCDPRVSVTPLESSVTLFPFESLIVMLSWSSSRRILCC